ncbi:hypothetical protein K5L18_28075, partial [Klebsiella pneumoniae]|nr:hypothetical protein [Klebsiella pneumoniae]MCD1478662.1 hypothetical protein [Klebsiella pneumoniae]MCD1496157.1 hypothetical protein [Klebsiella pneumoniae]MCD1507322.1 hypothetical protein [Klebsiella pneumoniae]MCD1518680.1 hypothetical protein [Klebsiella pneumoniae]
SAQIREILISESAWEEMTCLFAPSLIICDLKRSLYTSMYSECIMICILKIAITYNDLFFVAQLKRICSNKCKDINA